MRTQFHQRSEGRGMNLVACEAPQGVLDAAPATSLRQDSSTERWTGFWGTDDRYYARCTTATDEVGSPRQPEPVTTRTLTESLGAPLGDRRRTLLFRVGRSASHGCVFGVRRPTTRATVLRA